MKSGVFTILSWAARAPIVLLWGPPYNIGNTAVSIFYEISPFFEKIIPLLGPLNDLWVVEDTTSAYSNGSFASYAATNPEICAISTRRYAPTSSQISLNLL